MRVNEAGGGVPALFAAVADIGPFFAVATGPPPDGGGWVPLRALHAPTPSAHDPLTARVEAVRQALGADTRVAASTAFQGLAAQLVSPLFAAVTTTGALPTPLLDALHWRAGGAGPWWWWATGGRVVPCDATGLADVLLGLLTPLVAAVRARASVSPRVLWGDAASAVATARRLVVSARPDAGARATALAEHLLTTPPLAATSALRAPAPPDLRWTFRRRSCCLYHRVPGGGLCEDCVLQDRARRPPGANGRT